jgi:hypothetical protein
MSYRCKNHPDVELSVFQPANGASFVEPCIECAKEKGALHNQILSLQDEFNKAMHKKLERVKTKMKKKGGKRK